MTCIADASGLNTVHTKKGNITAPVVNVSTEAQFLAEYANPTNKIINVTAPMTVTMGNGDTIANNFGIAGNGLLTLISANTIPGVQTGQKLISLISSSNVCLEGIKFDGQDSTFGLLSIGRPFNGAPNVGTCDNIFISNCEFTRAFMVPINIQENSHDIEICYNHFYDWGVRDDFVEGIYVGSSTHDDDIYNLLIEGNHFENNTGGGSLNGAEAIDVKPGAGLSGPIWIRRNYIHNIVVSSQGAITIGQKVDPIANSEVYVEYNEIHDIRIGRFNGYGINGQAMFGSIHGNIVYDTEGAGIALMHSSFSGAVAISHNTVDGDIRINDDWSGTQGAQNNTPHPITENCNAYTGDILGVSTGPTASWTKVTSGAFTAGIGGAYDPTETGPLDSTCTGGITVDACGRTFNGEIGAFALETCCWIDAAATQAALQAAMDNCPGGGTLDAVDHTTCGNFLGFSTSGNVTITASTITVPAGAGTVVLNDLCDDTPQIVATSTVVCEDCLIVLDNAVCQNSDFAAQIPDLPAGATVTKTGGTGTVTASGLVTFPTGSLGAQTIDYEVCVGDTGNALINGDFSDGFNGWTSSNMTLQPLGQYPEDQFTDPTKRGIGVMTGTYTGLGIYNQVAPPCGQNWFAYNGNLPDDPANLLTQQVCGLVPGDIYDFAFQWSSVIQVGTDFPNAMLEIVGNGTVAGTLDVQDHAELGDTSDVWRTYTVPFTADAAGCITIEINDTRTGDSFGADVALGCMELVKRDAACMPCSAQITVIECGDPTGGVCGPATYVGICSGQPWNIPLPAGQNYQYVSGDGEIQGGAWTGDDTGAFGVPNKTVTYLACPIGEPFTSALCVTCTATFPVLDCAPASCRLKGCSF